MLINYKSTTISHFKRFLDCFRVCTLCDPLTSLEFYRTIPDVFSVHLSHCFDVVILTKNRHESKTLRLQCFLVSHYLSLDEGIVFLEGISEYLVCDLVPQVTTENAIVVVRPLLESRVLPLLPRCLPRNLGLCFLLIPVL